MEENGKSDRVLGIYTKLLNGEVVCKSEEALRYDVNERTIQRDIDSIRLFLEAESEKSGFVNDVIYDRREKGYRLEKLYSTKLSNGEVLAVCKILLDSRAFTKPEMESMLKKLIEGSVPKENQKLVTEMVSNEAFHYTELRHGQKFIDRMWEIAQAIRGSRFIEISYKKLKETRPIKRKLKPVAIMFSEFYFYLAAFIENKEDVNQAERLDDKTPTIYRIDRIKKLKVLDERFRIPYSSRFEEGEFRKRIQFMTGGSLKKVRFRYSGLSIEAVLDKIPTAEIVEEKDGVYTIEAEVYGNGIDRWLKGQGEDVC